MGNRFTFLLGGARSGKSALAQSLALRWGEVVCVVATAEAIDDEMSARILRHRVDRPATWTTVEEPVEVSLAASRAGDIPLVIDCMTVWLGNVMHHGWDDGKIFREVSDLGALLSARSAPTIVVSNEVGMGVHPQTVLGRHYCDLLGRINASLAARASDAYLLVAGRLLRLEDPGVALSDPTLTGAQDGT